MAARYGVRNLRGLGFYWTDRAIEYVIGLREARSRAPTAGSSCPKIGRAHV